MSRGPNRFRQRDLTRALRATLAAGIEVARIEIAPDGTVVIVPGKVADEPENTSARSSWDGVW